MKSFKSLLVLTMLIYGVTFAMIGHAIEYKCTCTCKDDVGTWTQSCYSTSDCTVCCSYKKKATLAPSAKGVALSALVETAQGSVDVAPSKVAKPQTGTMKK